jgi:hypothetical protein
MERIGLAIVAKNGQQYGGEGDALHKTLAKVKEGWIRLEWRVAYVASCLLGILQTKVAYASIIYPTTVMQ